jgi:phage shock protein PspC (stress-responsive transcriptional regulator)
MESADDTVSMIARPSADPIGDIPELDVRVVRGTVPMCATMGIPRLELVTNMIDDDRRPEGAPGTPGDSPTWRPVRAREGWIGGVCAGLAAASGLEVALVRLAFVLAVPSGIGGTVYLVLWVLTPRAGSNGVSDPRPAPSSTANTIKLLLLAGAIVGPVGGLFIFDPFPWDDAGGWFGVLLIALGIAWLVRRDADGVATQSPPSPFPPPTLGASSSPAPPVPPPVEPAVTSARSATQEPGLDSTLGMTPPPTRGGETTALPEPRGRAGDVVLAVVMWLGVLALIAFKLVTALLVWSETVDLPAPGLFFGLSTVILVAMIVAAATRRALFYGLAVVAAVVLFVVGTVVASFNGDVGDSIERVATVDELESPYEHAFGDLSLDLSAVDLGGETTTVVARNGIGRLDVIAPDGVNVEVSYDVQAADIVLFGSDRRDVWDESGDEISRGAESAGTLLVDVEMGLGSLRVCRAAEADLISAKCN